MKRGGRDSSFLKTPDGRVILMGTGSVRLKKFTVATMHKNNHEAKGQSPAVPKFRELAHWTRLVSMIPRSEGGGDSHDAVPQRSFLR